MSLVRLPLRDYTVGWISALAIEHAAAAEMLDEEHEQPPYEASDPTLYTVGRIGKHNVVISCLPAGELGTANAATVATRLAQRFPSVKIGLMVGVGAGVPSDEDDIRLGDVVVSQPKNGNGGVLQYDFGKAIEGGQFQQSSHLNTPPTLLLNALNRVRSNRARGRSDYGEYLAKLEQIPKFAREATGPDLLFDPSYPHESGVTCKRCNKEKLLERETRPAQEVVQIHHGTIASGNTLLRDAAKRDRISKELGGGILCFEMEAAGLMNNFPCLVIRGICDYGDSHKNKKWQPYAAATAAAYAKEILSAIPVADMAQLTPIRGT